MKIIIKNDGYKGYMVSNRKKYTDEEIESAIKALKIALTSNRAERMYESINEKPPRMTHSKAEDKKY